MYSGEITINKFKLANAALIEWQGRTQKKEVLKKKSFVGTSPVLKIRGCVHFMVP